MYLFKRAYEFRDRLWAYEHTKVTTNLGIFS